MEDLDSHMERAKIDVVDRWKPALPAKHTIPELEAALRRAELMWPASTAKYTCIKGTGSSWARAQTLIIRKLLSRLEVKLICMTFNERLFLANSTKPGALLVERALPDGNAFQWTQ